MDHGDRLRMEDIYVTKSFLPPIVEYQNYINKIWTSNQLTNQGPLLQELENSLEKYLEVNDLQFVANGTLALQIALKALDITEGEVITTPFSYVATSSAILWERCEPVFVDIEPETFCINTDKIEAAITDRTKAIMPVHVFGNPCDVEKIEAIAKKHNLKVIYDAAHAFGVKYKGKSLLSYGDISICSFHSTKIFHTIEGGCIISKERVTSDKVELIKRFGHNFDEHIMIGINAKASEFHAAMGLCNLKYVKENITKRKSIFAIYNSYLSNYVRKPVVNPDCDYNYSYYPILFKSEENLVQSIKKLKQESIFPRRYFFPSLNTLHYIKNKTSCPISEDVVRRILCLPLYPELDEAIVKKICGIIGK